MKRIRPAPMGRAFRVVKRMAHLTVEVAERPAQDAAARGAGARRAKQAGAGKTRPAAGESDGES